MTFEIGLVLAILAVAFVLFVTEWVRMDLVALLVLAILAVTGLVTPSEALAGFGNPAVVTVWAMFMLSAALTRTGVADIIGRQVLRLAGGGSEARMVGVIMLTSGGLSAFMNNIGVAALLLPVVMDVARRTGRPPSRLLMPLAYGTLLGGLTTLIGTPPNLVASEALRGNGLAPFELFDFTPVGGVAALVGVAFVALIGRHILPQRDPGRESAPEPGGDLRQRYALKERTLAMRVLPDSPLCGMTLEESRLGLATGLYVHTVWRDSRPLAAPRQDFVLEGGDLLAVTGRQERLDHLRGWRELVLDEVELGIESLVSERVAVSELRVAEGSALAGRSLLETRFRERCGVIVLATRRDATVRLTRLADVVLRAGDQLLVQGTRDQLAALKESSDFEALPEAPVEEMVARYELEHRLFAVDVPHDSVLVGLSLTESRLGDALGLGVAGIVRAGERRLLPEASTIIEAGDRLLVRGRPQELDVFRGLQQLEIETGAEEDLPVPTTDEVGLIEATLSPRGRLVGSTLRQLDFRSRYGLQVLAILREGTVHRSELREMELRFGDLLLLLGPREKAVLLAREPDFLVLTQEFEERRDTSKAPLAAVIMAAVLAPVLVGWLPIAIAAVAGTTLMVATRCLRMDDAYRAVEWRSIFLISGMLPLGVALTETGAANFLAEGVMAVTEFAGPWGVIIGLYLVTAMATMVIPTAALVVLMSPIALKASADLGISPHAAMMAVAIAASASFTSPISHPANILVMGPGGYRFSDYVKLGVPLTIVILIVALLILPWAWPL